MCPKEPLIALTTEGRSQPAAPNRHPCVADRGNAALEGRNNGSLGSLRPRLLAVPRGTPLSAPPRGTRWGPFTRVDSRRSCLSARRGLTRNGGKCGPAAFEGQRSGTEIPDVRPRRDGDATRGVRCAVRVRPDDVLPPARRAAAGAGGRTNTLVRGEHPMSPRRDEGTRRSPSPLVSQLQPSTCVYAKTTSAPPGQDVGRHLYIHPMLCGLRLMPWPLLPRDVRRMR